MLLSNNEFKILLRILSMPVIFHMQAGKSQAQLCYFWDISHLDSLAVCRFLRDCSVFDRIWQKNFLMVKYHWIPSLMSTRASVNWLTCDV